MKPSILAVNCNPTEMALASPESEIGGVAELVNKLHGHADAPDVVNVAVNGADIGVPPRLFAPLTVTLYVDPATRAVDGVKLAAGPTGSWPAVPGTTAPVWSVRVTLADPGWTEVSKLTAIDDVTGTDVDWLAAVRPTTAGAAPGATVK